MKKFLSLVLALAMTMSLVTVSAGAKDFTDDSAITYEEAVDVMSAVKVLDGYTDGSFNPQGGLTRGAAAKIICNMILGPTTASALNADTAPYKDVPADSTFAGYIAYCAKEGIISGYADGTFRPSAPLTGYAFMKMLLGALGYDSDIEGYTGANWSVNVAKRALNLGLNDGLVGEFVGSKALNREEAALYAFNTLQATMVEYEDNSTITVGDIVISNKSTAKDMKYVDGKYDGNIENDDLMQFAEKYFTDLKLTEGSDDFGRPANTWKVKSSEVGTYAQEADLTYTDEVKGETIYADLDKGTIDTITVKDKDGDEVTVSAITYIVDGLKAADALEGEDGDEDFAIAKSNEDVKVGARGALTEVFYDDDDETVIITTINTYLAQVSGDYDEDDEELDIDFIDDCDYEGQADTTLSIDDLSNLDEFEDEDYVLVTIASEDPDDASEQYVYSIELAEKVTATVTAYTKDSSVKADGTTYKYNATYNEGDGPDSYVIKDDYDLYLDFYGNVIFADGVEAEDNVVYIVEAAYDGNAISGKAVAAAIFLDGTYEVITLNKDENGDKYKDYAEKDLKAVAGWYEYKEKSDGTYDLTEDLEAVLKPTTGMDKVTEKDSIYVAGVRANAKTQFVVTEDTDESGKTYTGIKNVPAVENSVSGDVADVAIVMDGTTNYAKYVLIVLNDAKDKSVSKSSDLIYILDEYSDETVNEDEDSIYTYDAIVNGKVTTIDVHEDCDNAASLVVGGLYEDIVYEDDIITDLSIVTADDDDFVDCEDYTIETYEAEAKITQKGSVVTFADVDETSANGDGYYLASGAKIFVIEDNDAKIVTAKKLVSDYSPLTTEVEVTGVIEDGEFTYLFINLDYTAPVEDGE